MKCVETLIKNDNPCLCGKAEHKDNRRHDDALSAGSASPWDGCWSQLDEHVTHSVAHTPAVLPPSEPSHRIRAPVASLPHLAYESAAGLVELKRSVSSSLALRDKTWSRNTFRSILVRLISMII